MIIFPYGTDAPIYHRPIVTIGLIVVNILVFVLQIAYPEQAVEYMLAVGDGIHPVQWLTSFFMHGDPLHLIGNMIFLWSFGLVVEGKLGSWLTLAVYLGIGITENILSQFVLLGAEPNVALGASTAIYGLMALCLIWAPENSMECVLIVIFHFVVRTSHFEVAIKVMVGLYIAIDVLFLILQGGAVSSEYFHVLGAVLGAVVGVVLLKAGWVDCENWDLFSVMAGRHRMSPEEIARIEAEKPAAKRKKAEEDQKQENLMKRELQRAIREGHVLPAIKIYEKMKQAFSGQAIFEPELLSLIQMLSEKQQRTEAVELMKEYLETYSEKASLVRLKLARLYVETDHPNQALKTLQQIDPTSLDSRQRAFFEKIRTAAETLQRRHLKNGEYELAE